MVPESEVEERDSGTDVHEEQQYDAEEPQVEWHLWLAALLLVGGVALLVVPEGMVPGLVAGLGPLFVLLAVMAWAGQWAYRWYR